MAGTYLVRIVPSTFRSHRLSINPYRTPLPKDVINVSVPLISASELSLIGIQVKAGDRLTAEWHHTLAGADPSDSADPVDPSHHGPVMSYLFVFVPSYNV